MKIGFCGTMSVGKTTLVNALKELEEFKDYNFRTERSKHLMSMGIPLNTAELMQDNIITDRTIIDVMAFAQCSDSMNYLEKDKFTQLSASLIHEYDYIFYVSPEGVGIEDNGVRETDSKYRELIDFTINMFLDRYQYRIKNLIKIKGTTKERIKTIQETLSLQYV